VFLTEDELRHLTGLKMPSAQRRWLGANGYSFDVRADGSNVVLVDAVRARHGLEHVPAPGARPAGPDLEALRRVL
jgi:hypothetical protein